MLGRRGGALRGPAAAAGDCPRAGHPPLNLVLDEPTEGIQPSIIKDIERVIRSLAARGDMAMLLVEQYSNSPATSRTPTSSCSAAKSSPPGAVRTWTRRRCAATNGITQRARGLISPPAGLLVALPAARFADVSDAFDQPVSTGGVKMYPVPRTVLIIVGLCGSSSSFRRRRPT